MVSKPTITGRKKRSIHALEASNFFIADVQTGLGPFVAAYLGNASMRFVAVPNPFIPKLSDRHAGLPGRVLDAV
jgi:hypothetical protein